MERIPPGGEGKITATFDTNGYSEKIIFQEFKIYTNDPVHPTLDVSFQGTVEKFADITPKSVRLAGKTNTPITATVKIIPLQKYPFKILKIKAKEGRYIRCKIEEKADSGVPAYLISIENTKKDPGPYKDAIVLKTDSNIIPEIQIPVNGNILE